MATEQKKGLGLLGKLILFSLVPSYIIAGVLVYLYDRDLKDAITQKYIFWIALVGYSLVLIAVFYVVHRVLLLRIKLLAKGADALAQGELGHRLPVTGKDEIGYLTGSFNAMASSLQNLMEGERDKVRQFGILHESAIHLATEESLDALMDRLVEYPRHLIKSEMATLYLLDPQSGEVIHFKHSGVDLTRYPIQEQPKGTGLIGAFLKDRASVRLEDIRQDPRSRGLPTHHPPIRNFMGVPLILADKIIGGMAIANKSDGTAYTQEDEDLLTTLSFQAATAIERMRLFEESKQLAMFDGLTGLLNHREFQKRLTEELERSKRYSREFSLLMLDIDHFKSFNDTYGHPVGDLVLKELGSIIKQTVRTMDIPARYGGEEFAIIAPETSAEKGKLLSERLRKNIFEHPFQTPTGDQAALSVSIGVASYPLDAHDREGLIQAADQALYFAKEAGRNAVYAYSETLKSAIERNHAKLRELLLDPSLKAVKDLASVIDAKSPYTRGHSEEVTRYAVHLAEALGLDESKKESLRIASLLHNIGIVSIPDRVINKPGPLNIEERKIIQAHPMLAEMILKKVVCSEEITQAILYHHERFDGTGYPNGLRGEEIPYLARVLAVVEAYHAMISIRPYRRRLNTQEALEELRQNAGTQFDPGIVETFQRMIER